MLSRALSSACMLFLEEISGYLVSVDAGAFEEWSLSNEISLSRMFERRPSKAYKKVKYYISIVDSLLLLRSHKPLELGLCSIQHRCFLQDLWV